MYLFLACEQMITEKIREQREDQGLQVVRSLCIPARGRV